MGSPATPATILCLLALLGDVAAADGSQRSLTAVWHYLPRVVYAEETLPLHVELPEGWWLEADGARLAGGHHELTAAGLGELVVRDGAGAVRERVALVDPGSGVALQVVGLRLQRTDDHALAVLRLPRREYEADRRWALVHGLSGDAPVACGRRVALDAPVSWGHPALLHLIARASGAEALPAGIVYELPTADRVVGWRHREYRQLLAWLTADARHRGAERVVLVVPPAPARDAEELAGLRVQIRDVARTYGGEVIDTAALAVPGCWTVAAGLPGESLNAEGRAAYEALLQPLLEPER